MFDNVDVILAKERRVKYSNQIQVGEMFPSSFQSSESIDLGTFGQISHHVLSIVVGYRVVVLGNRYVSSLVGDCPCIEVPWHGQKTTRQRAYLVL